MYTMTELSADEGAWRQNEGKKGGGFTVNAWYTMSVKVEGKKQENVKGAV